jgi:NADH-quinone oxidoreductase subunit M
MFFIILMWGGKERVYASYKFFLYTLAGSIFLFIVIVYIYLTLGTVNIIELQQLLPKQSLGIQKWLWLGMFISFAVKTPMWPVHTWLPDAHVQAPTAGSMILAGILLKMGGYGFIRFSIPMLPQATEYYQIFVFTLSVVAIVYASFLSFAQTNMKKLVAYSSIAHMGYVTLGLFSANIYGISGAMFQMISHGLVSAALFLAVGILSDITGSKDIDDYGGVASKMPCFAVTLMIVVLSSIGLPGTSGFVGEFLSLLGAYKVHKIFAFIAATGVVTGAIYMLLLYKKVMFGKFNALSYIKEDINCEQKVIFILFVFLIILLGVYPSIITDMLSPNIVNLVTNIKSYGF